MAEGTQGQRRNTMVADQRIFIARPLQFFSRAVQQIAWVSKGSIVLGTVVMYFFKCISLANILVKIRQNKGKMYIFANSYLIPFYEFRSGW